MKKFLAISLASLAAGLASTASAAVVLNDSFTDGARIGGGDALGTSWYISNTTNGSSATVSGGALQVVTGTNTSNAANFVVGTFPSFTLTNPNDKITLTFDLSVSAGLVDQNNNIRFGLFNSNGTTLAADVAGTNYPEQRDDSGFFYRYATDTNATVQSSYMMRVGDGSSTGLTSSNGTSGVQVHTLQTLNGWGAVTNSDVNAMKLELTRNESNGIVFGVYRNDSLQYSSTITVASPTTFTFDQIAFSATSTNMTYNLDNIQVAVIPEPSTYAAIFGVSVLGLALVRRRFRR